MQLNIAVLLAGILDSKWPLRELSDLADQGQQAAPRILSPFDAAALELALRLRDVHGDNVQLTVVLPAQTAVDPLLSTVAAYRSNNMIPVDLSSLDRWDAGQLSLQVKLLLESFGSRAHLVLLGREFGDCDDGTIPPCIAERFAVPFIGLVQSVEWADTTLTFLREQAGLEEQIRVAPPVVASVTNDRRNRLRHPLFKNVLAAKHERFSLVTAPAVAEQCAITLTCTRFSTPRVRSSSCRFLEGRMEEQVAELVRFLDQSRRR